MRTREQRSRPWFRATLVLACPTCGAAPGEGCLRARKQGGEFHVARYERARELAGEPIRRARTAAEPS